MTLYYQLQKNHFFLFLNKILNLNGQTEMKSLKNASEQESGNTKDNGNIWF